MIAFSNLKSFISRSYTMHSGSILSSVQGDNYEYMIIYKAIYPFRLFPYASSVIKSVAYGS